MRALSALLCLVFLPAIGRANCIQEGIEIAAGYQQQLPASVTPKERETVESAAGTQVEHAVCSRMAPGRMDLERSQVRAVISGYLALTDRAVLFVRAKQRFALPLHKYDVFLEAPYRELNAITDVSSPVGPNVMLELVMEDETGASVQVPRGRDGNAIVAELRARLIAACGTPLVSTAREVRCR